MQRRTVTSLNTKNGHESGRESAYKPGGPSIFSCNTKNGSGSATKAQLPKSSQQTVTSWNTKFGTPN